MDTIFFSKEKKAGISFNHAELQQIVAPWKISVVGNSNPIMEEFVI